MQIAEFKVQQANYSAEFGQGGGTITQIVSKSGTNQFHGSAFEFIRNSVFDAANWLPRRGLPFQRNEFGTTIGGPIIRNKAFFFGEYSGFRQRYGTANQHASPHRWQRTGLVTINGYEYQVRLTLWRKQILNKYPLPNQPLGQFGENTITRCSSSRQMTTNFRFASL